MFNTFSKIGKKNFIYGTFEIENSLLMLLVKDSIYCLISIGLLISAVLFAVSSDLKYLNTLLVPIVMVLFFGYKVAVNYCVARSGYYTVLEGICVDTPKASLPMERFKRKVKRDTRFLIETVEGRSIYIRGRTFGAIPRLNSQVTIVIPNMAKIIEDGDVWRVNTYLTLKSIMKNRKKIDL